VSCAAAASLVLLEPGRFVAGCVAFEAFEAPATLATDAATGAARAAEVDEDFFPGEGATLVADVFLAEEEADLACVTFLVGSSEHARRFLSACSLYHCNSPSCLENKQKLQTNCWEPFIIAPQVLPFPAYSPS